MSALQYIVSIVLHNSGAKKKAFTRLHEQAGSGYVTQEDSCEAPADGSKV